MKGGAAAKVAMLQLAVAKVKSGCAEKTRRALNPLKTLKPRRSFFTGHRQRAP